MSDLLSRLHEFSDVSILAIVVGVIVISAMVAPHLGRLVFRSKSDKVHTAALDAFKAVTAMIGVVLAFALVQANGNLKNVEGIVGKEAASIAAADRALLRSGNPDLVKVRPALAAYAQSIIDDEWPSLVDNERSEKTDDLYNALSKQVRAVNPADARQQVMFAELLKHLDDMADLREQLIAESGTELPSFFWVTTSGLLILGLVLALFAAPNMSGTVSIGAGAAAVALLLAFVFIVDQPFEGETSIKPTEITKAIQLNARRS